MYKRIVCMLLCVIFILPGCGKTEEVVDTVPFSYETMQIGYDAQPCFETMFSSITSTENGYYYFDISNLRSSSISSISYLMFFDKKTRQSVPVCSKADCNHTLEEDCDAVFSVMSEYNSIDQTYYLWYYDGYLYTMVVDRSNSIEAYYVYQISLDGSKRTKYIKLFEGEIDGFNAYFHRGYVYISFESEENKGSFYRVKLEKDAKPELIFEFSGIGAICAEFDVYDTGVSFVKNYYTDETYENIISTVEYYNPVTQEVTTLMENIYFDSYKIIDNEIYYSRSGEIYIYNINSKEEKLFYSCDYPVYLTYDGEYLYAEVCSVSLNDYSNHYIYVLNLEGELVDTIQAASSQDCYYGDKDYLFQMFDMNEELTGKADMAVIKAFDKSQIGSEEHEWIELPIPKYVPEY